jgi:hypothetical protein
VVVMVAVTISLTMSPSCCIMRACVARWLRLAAAGLGISCAHPPYWPDATGMGVIAKAAFING